MIFLGITIGGTVGGGLGNMLDHQSFWGFGLGGWSILLGGAGSFVGIWIGYKAAQNLGV